MKKKTLLTALMLILALLFVPGLTRTAQAAETTGVIHSIFAADGSRESGRVLRGDPGDFSLDRVTGHEPEDQMGEVVVEEGQSVTDSGFFNTFVTNEIINGQNVRYGTQVFSTSLSYWYDGTTLHDATTDAGYVRYVNPDYESAYAVNYDINTGTGGRQISYKFTGVRSTEGKYITLYFHYHFNGREARGNEIAREGWLAYRIKVIPKQTTPQPAEGEYGAHLRYDANGGTINGSTDIYDDMANRQTSDRMYRFLDLKITDMKPVREGYTFAFWINPLNYKDNHGVYAANIADVDRTKYPQIQDDDLSSTSSVIARNPDNTRLLQAVWDKDYSVTYLPNGGSSTPDPQTGNFGLTITRESVTPVEDDKHVSLRPEISREGYTFTGWKDTATGTLYPAGADYAVTFAEPHRVLEAQWERIPHYGAYVKYDANGGTLKGAATFDDTEHRQESPQNQGLVTIPVLPDVPTREGYRFLFWVDKANYPQNHQVYLADGTTLDTRTYTTIPASAVTSSVQIPAADPDATRTLTAVWDKDYSVVYDANGGTSTPDSLTGVFGLNVTDTSIAENTEDKSVTLASAITRPGYFFAGWKDDATGVVYGADSAYVVPFAEPHRKLIAQWTPEYAGYVRYDANGGSIKGGATFEDTEHRQISRTDGDDLRIAVIPDTPVREGYTFVGWVNAQPGAQGDTHLYLSDAMKLNTTMYPDLKNASTQASVRAANPDGVTTLQALWDKDYSVTYRPNGGSSTPDSQSGMFGANVTDTTITPNTADKHVTLRPEISREGYIFTGWKDAATGTLYPAGADYAVTFADPHRVLEAQWERIPHYGAYVKYDANGGSMKGSATFDDTEHRQESAQNGGLVSIPVLPDVPVRDGYRFLFWVDEANYPQSHQVYLADGSTTDVAQVAHSVQIPAAEPDATRTLTAVWDKDYSVTYRANGGSSTPDPQTGMFGAQVTDASITSNTEDMNVTLRPEITREGYRFLGWKDTATGALYPAAAQYTVTYEDPHRILEAQWERIPDEPEIPVTPVVPVVPEVPVTPPAPFTPEVHPAPQPQHEPARTTLARTGADIIALAVLALVAVFVGAGIRLVTEH
ncbi:InlB B-repeat-containing protein [Alloscardovia macacae]|nr:InlB B-repeat-containing protein [Alloscardovia macacae]